MLRAEALCKRFGATVALDGAGLVLRAGEIHALMGQNGAGKSTLIKLLTGAESPDSGLIEMDGRPIAPATPLQAQREGISTVYQEVNLCPNLTVAENLFAGRYPRRWTGLIDHAKVSADARALLEGLHLHIDVDRRLGSYPVPVQQMVAIARALGLSARVLILDEPTSSLDQNEVEELFTMMRRLRDRGMAILFVTHFLDQVYAVSDRITVLRNGSLVGEYLTAELPQAALVTAMVGREVAVTAPRSAEDAVARDAPLTLDARGLGRRGVVGPLDIAVREGEVLGLGGLLGSGRTEFARLLFGLDRADTGPSIDSAERVLEQWEVIKARERRDKGVERASVLDGLPVSSPALTTALEIGKRVAKVNFDWPDTEAVHAKIREEIDEIHDAVARGDASHVAEEVGDLLFSVAEPRPEARCRSRGRAPQREPQVLERFRQVEARVADEGRDIATVVARRARSTLAGGQDGRATREAGVRRPVADRPAPRRYLRALPPPPLRPSSRPTTGLPSVATRIAPSRSVRNTSAAHARVAVHDIRRRVPEAIRPPGAEHDHVGTKCRHPRRARTRAAAVVGRLDHEPPLSRDASEDLPLGRVADVAGQDDLHVAVAKLEDDRVVVPHALPFPLGTRAGCSTRTSTPSTRTISPAIDVPEGRADDVAQHPATPASGTCLGTGIPSHTSAGPQPFDDPWRPADVVGIAVRERQPRQARYAERAHGGHDHASAHVERRPRRTARVDQHRRARRELHQRRIALPHVEERDGEHARVPRVPVPRAASAPEATRARAQPPTMSRSRATAGDRPALPTRRARRSRSPWRARPVARATAWSRCHEHRHAAELHDAPSPGWPPG